MSVARDESDGDFRSGSRFQIPPKSRRVIKGFGSDPTLNHHNSLDKTESINLYHFIPSFNHMELLSQSRAGKGWGRMPCWPEQDVGWTPRSATELFVALVKQPNPGWRFLVEGVQSWGYDLLRGAGEGTAMWDGGHDPWPWGRTSGWRWPASGGLLPPTCRPCAAGLSRCLARTAGRRGITGLSPFIAQLLVPLPH